MNSLHKDYFIQAGFGFGRPLRTFLRIVFVFGFVFVLMIGNGYFQAQRLIGQWESPSGNTVLEFNRDGTARVWTYRDGWSDYQEWYINAFHDNLSSPLWWGIEIPFRVSGSELELMHGMSRGDMASVEWFDFTRLHNTR